MSEAPPMISGASKSKKIFLAVIVVSFALVLASVVAWVLIPPKIVIEADAGFKKATQTINPEELRAWALESIKRWPSTNGSQTIPESEVPQYIRNLYPYPPEDVVVMGDTVGIIWGGGFFHWWIEVGPTNFVRSPDKSQPARTAEWTQGIYYSHEGNRKIQ